MGNETGKVRCGHERTAAGLTYWAGHRSATCLRTKVGTVSKGASVQGVAGVALVGRGRKLTVLALLPRQGREEVSVVQGDNQARLVRVWRGLGRTSTALSKPICSFWAMPYLCVERARVRLEPIANTRSRLGLILGNLQHNFVVHRRLDVALGTAARGERRASVREGHSAGLGVGLKRGRRRTGSWRDRMRNHNCSS